jgi:hypothetical protein
LCPLPNIVPDTGRLARASHVCGVTDAATLGNRILGLTRDQVLAARFGAGNEMDVFTSRSGARQASSI